MSVDLYSVWVCRICDHEALLCVDFYSGRISNSFVVSRTLILPPNVSVIIC